MKNNILIKSLITAALLILAIPIGASAQVNRDRSYNRYDSREQYDRVNRREVRMAIQRLDNVAARLEDEANAPRGRRVLGFFWGGRTDSRAVLEIRNFRSAVAQLRHSATDQDGFAGSRDEARLVLDLGVRLDRNLRLRTGSSSVDASLSELRSNLHLIADAYGLRMPLA